MNNGITHIIENTNIGDDVILKLDDAEQNQLASIAITKQAHHYLDIVSQYLDHKIYDNEAFTDAVKDLATGNPKAKIRILIKDSDKAVKQGHRLVDLAKRLTSFIDIRIQGERHKEFNEAWLIIDTKAWIRRPFADKYAAEINYSATRQLRETSITFETMWQEANLDPNLRRLSL